MTDILDETSVGFEADVFLCGEKGPPISLGGIAGAAGMFRIIRNMPQYAPMYTSQKSTYNGEISDDIVITKANFGTEVSVIYF